MSVSRKDKVIRNFSHHADSYDDNAGLQIESAKCLAAMLPDVIKDKPPARILEIGCGTGVMSRNLLDKYPDAHIDVTDISPEMLEIARAKIGPVARARFFVMDGEIDVIDGDYDLIVSAMTPHWFDDPLSALRRLSGCAPLYYSVPGARNFTEWHSVTGGRDALPLVDWPGVINADFIEKDYGSANGFLRMLKRTGVSAPSENYTGLKAGALKKAIQDYQRLYGGRATWHVLYGRLGAD